MTKTEEFFKDNAVLPTSWSVGVGSYISFSVQKMIYDRDEKEIKSLVAQYKLNQFERGGYVTFSK